MANEHFLILQIGYFSVTSHGHEFETKKEARVFLKVAKIMSQKAIGRWAFADSVHEQSGLVVDVSGLQPVIGAITAEELKGKLFICE